MAVKSGQKTPATDESLNVVEEFSGEEVSFEATFTQKIFDFLEKQKLQDSSPIFYLYKYEDLRSGEMKSFIQKYRDCDPPDEDDIGKEFGSGRYLLCMSIPRQGGGDSIMRAYRFRVHSRYDTIAEKNREVKEVPPVVVSPAPVQTGPTFQDAFNMFERMFSIIAPIMNRPRDENVSAVLQQSYSAMGDMMKRSLLDNYRMIGELSKTLLIPQGNTEMDTTTFDDETQEKGASILETLMPLLQEWLPKLIGGGVQGQMVGAAIKNTPQFKALVNDKMELMKIINFLDQSRGPEETDKILTALNIKRLVAAKKPAAQKQPAKAGK